MKSGKTFQVCPGSRQFKHGRATETIADSDGILDDVDTDSVFHAAAGVEELDLAENDRLDPLCKVVESNKGGGFSAP